MESDTNRSMFLRDPVDCYKVENGKLTLNLFPGNIYKREPMSAVWARQQHGTFSAETEINFTPRNDKEIAGLALLQKEDHNFVLGKTIEEGQADDYPDPCREEQRHHRLSPYQGRQAEAEGRRS